MVEYQMHFYEDYRANSRIWFLRGDKIADDNEDEEEAEAPCGSIFVEPADTGGYSIYMAYFSNLDYLTAADLVLKSGSSGGERASDLLLQIHSHINECGPFEGTGFTSSWKETGSYGDAIPVTNQFIMALDVDKYECSKPCAAIVVDDKGNIVNVLSICPHA
jgi:hypothetical protein